jgi:hypothetical protein
VTVLAFGAKILAGMLAKHGSGRREEEVVCRCGQRMESRGVRGKEMMTILGSVPYERSLFTCPACRETRYPGDEVLDVYDAGPICFRRTRPWLQATGECPLMPDASGAHGPARESASSGGRRFVLSGHRAAQFELPDSLC